MHASPPLTYTVSGMTCGHYRQAVTDEITQLEDVQEVNVDLGTGHVVVNGQDLADGAARAVIDEAGCAASNSLRLRLRLRRFRALRQEDQAAEEPRGDRR